MDVVTVPDAECLVLCLRSGEQEELHVAERVGDSWQVLHEDAPGTGTTAAQLRTLLRTATMEVATRWQVPTITDRRASEPPLSVLDASAIVAGVRSGEPAQLDAALDDAGLRQVPCWLRAIDGAARGQVTVVRHTPGRYEVLVDVLATAQGWVMLRLEDDLIRAEPVHDLLLQSWLDAAVRDGDMEPSGVVA